MHPKTQEERYKKILPQRKSIFCAVAQHAFCISHKTKGGPFTILSMSPAFSLCQCRAQLEEGTLNKLASHGSEGSDPRRLVAHTQTDLPGRRGHRPSWKICVSNMTQLDIRTMSCQKKRCSSISQQMSTSQRRTSYRGRARYDLYVCVLQCPMRLVVTRLEPAIAMHQFLSSNRPPCRQ